MDWTDVGAVLLGFLVFAGVGASSTWLAVRTQMHRRRLHAELDWLDVLDALEGTPPSRVRPSWALARFPDDSRPPRAVNRPSAAPLRTRA